MADIQTIAGTDTVNAALLTKCVNNFAALQNDFASETAPASPIAHQVWIDTSGSPVVEKRRNAANSAWVTQTPDVSATGGGLLPLTGGTMTGDLSFGGAVKAVDLDNATDPGDATNKGQVDARVHTVAVHLGTISASDEKYLWIVSGASTITISDVLIVSETGVTSDAGNLWTFQVRNLTAAADLRSAVKSTNGAAITADTAYALGLNQNLTPSAGAVLELQMAKTGSPNALTEMLAVVRYTLAT
jgi:hypothetical protein